MSRSSDRGQVDPLPAMVAVGAVCLGLSLYAGVLSAHLPTAPGSDARGALDAVHDHAARDGVIDPGALAGASTPDGRQLNATLTAGERRWAVGPTPPASGSRASRRASVRLGPGDVRPGRLRVVVW